MRSQRERAADRGAYGLRLEGLRSATLVSPVPSGWARVAVARRPLEELAAGGRRSDDVLEVRYPNGWGLRADRVRWSMTFFVPESVEDEELVHPFLSPPALDFACRLGHAVFHAGAFVAGGRAWVLFGEREAGKSTTLAVLARAGAQVVCDDILVLDGLEALAGPRCVDLRPEAAERLFSEAPQARQGLRRRLALPPIAPSTPLGGFFFLGWSDELLVEPLSVPARLAEISRYCRPEVRELGLLLELAALPAWRLGRPRRLELLDEIGGALLETAAH